jgi:hypothetical protein
MPLGGSGWLDKAEGGHTSERATSGHEEGAARSFERVVYPISSHHASPYHRIATVMSYCPCEQSRRDHKLR